MLEAYFFVLGLIFGSAANAIIWRINTGRSFWRGRSICPGCEHELSAVDLVPVLSWILLGAKCRYCKSGISWQYPAVELLTGGLFVFIWTQFHPNNAVGWVNLAFWLYLTVSAVVMAVYDLKWQILPDVVLIPAIVAAMVRLGVLFALGEPLSAIRGPLIAAIAAGSAFYALAAVSKGRWMGGGDIKLVFLLGLVLGLQKGLLAMFLATASAALIGGSLLMLRKLKTHYIAFGPFLLSAMFVAYFYGQPLIKLYLRLSGLDY